MSVIMETISVINLLLAAILVCFIMGHFYYKKGNEHAAKWIMVVTIALGSALNFVVASHVNDWNPIASHALYVIGVFSIVVLVVAVIDVRKHNRPQ